MSLKNTIAAAKSGKTPQEQALHDQLIEAAYFARTAESHFDVGRIQLGRTIFRHCLDILEGRAGASVGDGSGE